MARSQPVTYREPEAGVYVSKKLIAAIAVAGALAIGWLANDFVSHLASALATSAPSSDWGSPVSSQSGPVPDDLPAAVSSESVTPSASPGAPGSSTVSPGGGTTNVYLTIVNPADGSIPDTMTASPTGATLPAPMDSVQPAIARGPAPPGVAWPRPSGQVGGASAKGPTAKGPSAKGPSAKGPGSTQGPIIVGGKAVMVPRPAGQPASGVHAGSPAQALNLQFPSGMAATAIGEHIVIAYDGSIVYVGDNGSMTANTGPAIGGGTVALDAASSTFSSNYRPVVGATTAASGASTGTAPSPLWGSANTSGTAGSFNPLAIPSDASPLVSAFIAYTQGRTADVAGFEDHSVLTRGAGNVVTYDDSNVFVNRDGKINANTGDTDSAGLNAIATLRSTVSAGPHCDDGCDDESIIQAEAGVFDEGDVAVDGDGHVVWSPDIAPEAPPAAVDCDDPAETNDDGCDDSTPEDNGDDDDSVDDESPDGDVSDPAEPAETRDEADSTRPAADNGEEPDGEFPTGSLVVGGDGIDDLSLRVDGVGNVSSYDDSNVVIGGSGAVNAQIGDSDTGGTVTMDTVDSVVGGGNSR